MSLSWFSNSEEFDKLNKRNLLECIYFSKRINKSIMAPNISNSREKQYQITTDNKDYKNERTALETKYIEKTLITLVKILAKPLGIFIIIKKQQAIYGTTTPEERKETRR